MYAKAIGILCDEHLAEDAVHTAFLRVARNFNKIVPKLTGKKSINEITKQKNLLDNCPNVGGYMVVVVRNVCMDMIRKSNLNPTVSIDNVQNGYVLDIEDESEAEADEKYINNESVEKIIVAIKKMSETLSETLYMHIVLEMDSREIADKLNCNYETVRKRIQRGLKELRKVLEEK